MSSGKSTQKGGPPHPSASTSSSAAPPTAKPRQPALLKALPLFGDGGGDVKLGINQRFAQSYDERKRRQELAQAHELGLFARGEEVSSSDSSDDEGEQLTRNVEKGIIATIDAIRKKDPRIYDAKTTFFAKPAEDSAAEAPAKPAAKPAKKITAKDVMRQQLLDAAARGETDAFVDDDDLEATRRRRFVDEDEGLDKRVYDSEQKQLREDFLRSLKGGGGGGKEGTAATGGGGAEEDEDNLLRLRPKAAAAAGAGEGDDDDDGAGPAVAVSRNELREYLKPRTASKRVAEHADELADPDGFLQAYLRSRAWKDDEEEDGGAGATAGAGSRVPRYDEIVHNDAADIADVERADNFEAQYNFRFEAGATEIVTHARAVADSMRRKDTKRADDRERRRERKDEARAAAEAETRRLMNLKRREVQSRVAKIQEVAGAGVDFGRLAAAFADDLDAEWDPATHDRKMAELFGDGFYAEPEAEPEVGVGGAFDAEPAPAADDDDDEEEEEEEDGTGGGKRRRALPGWVFGDGPRPAWAGPSAQELAEGADGFEGVLGPASSRGGAGGAAAAPASGGADEEEEDEGAKEGGDDPAVTGGRRPKHKRKQRQAKGGAAAAAGGGGSTAVARARAMLAAGEASSAALLADADEVLALGFEDVIAGGTLRTRMRYVAVPAADYGLAPEELLAADDGDLNAYVGLKRLAPFREAEWVVPPRRRKHALHALRKKLRAAAGAVGVGEEEEEVGGGGAGEEGAAGAVRGGAAAERGKGKGGRNAGAAPAAAEAAEELAGDDDAEADADAEEAAGAGGAGEDEGAEGAEAGVAGQPQAGKKKRRRNKKRGGAGANKAAAAAGGGNGNGGGGAAAETAASAADAADVAAAVGHKRPRAAAAAAAVSTGGSGGTSSRVGGGAGPAHSEPSHRPAAAVAAPSAGGAAAPAHKSGGGGHKHKPHKDGHGDHHSGGHKAAAAAVGDAVVTLASGVTMKKSRLASYGL